MHQNFETEHLCYEILATNPANCGSSEKIKIKIKLKFINHTSFFGHGLVFLFSPPPIYKPACKDQKQQSKHNWNHNRNNYPSRNAVIPCINRNKLLNQSAN